MTRGATRARASRASRHGSCADDASQPLCGRRVCDGVARDTCGKRAGAETVCSPHACVDGRETTEARCADGVCPAAVTRDCAPYRCGPAGACATTCTGSSACAAGFECVDGACVTPGAPAADPAPHDASGGCGCRVGSASRDGGSVLALAALALALARRRRARHGCVPTDPS